MKRFITYLFALCLWTVCLHAQSGEFDPANPGDPQPFYELRVQVSPESGGKVNISRKMVESGQVVSLNIRTKPHFKLMQWVCGEEILSSQSEFEYVMPARNVVITAQMIYELDDFNPDSPEDPQGAQYRHWVTIYTTPSTGGKVSNSSFSMYEGEKKELYAYNNAGYEFIGWYINNQLESTSNPVTLTMRDEDISMTARFRFNPESPSDPGTNAYDVASGVLMIDHFTFGKLCDAVYSIIESSQNEDVRSFIVSGRMSAEDYGVVRNFSNVEMVDFSKTTGYTAIPAWGFENKKQLKRLLLPATIEKIGNHAFYNCTSLEEIVLYASVPPGLENDADNPFDGIEDGIILRVPSAALSLYQASDIWKSFIILPMDIQSLSVSLPDDKISLYENMFLELLDTKSEQLRRYVITNRQLYTYTDVFKGTAYQLTLRNAQNKVFGQEMVSFSGNDTTVTFSSLLTPIDVKLQVVNERGENVTQSSEITWLDEEKNFIRKSDSLTQRIEGEVLYYHVVLNEELGKQYIQPAELALAVRENQKTVICPLQPLEQIRLKGSVVDSISGLPIRNANVSITQTLNKKYTVTVTANTDENGLFSVLSYHAPSVINISALDYHRKEIQLEQGIDTIAGELKPLSGLSVVLNISFVPVSADATIPDVQDWYPDSKNLSYQLHNSTTGKDVRFEVRNTQLVLLDDINITDELQLSVQSQTNNLMPVTVSVANKNGRLTADVVLIELGALSVVSDVDEACVILLYDKCGKLVQSKQLKNNQVLFDHLSAGDYIIVAMQPNGMYNEITSLNDYDNLSLTQDEDYLKYEISVSDGLTTIASIGAVPDISSKVRYTGAETTFSVNKNTIVAGNYLTLRSKIDLKPEYEHSVSNMSLIVDLPEGTSLIENAVLVGNKAGSYTVSGNKLTIPVKQSEIVRFCVMPTHEGEHQAAAFVQFTRNDQLVLQPIGTVSFKVKNSSFYLPKQAVDTVILVSGLTIPDSKITVYEKEDVIGQGRSTASGVWRIKVPINKPLNHSYHYIHAEIEDPQGHHLSTVTKSVEYVKTTIKMPDKITMYYYEHAADPFPVVFDAQSGTTYPRSYKYLPERPEFIFAAGIENPQDTVSITEFKFKILLTTGRIKTVRGKFDKVRQEYRARILTSSEAGLPINVKAEMHLNIENDEVEYDSLGFAQQDERIANAADAFIDTLSHMEPEKVIDNESKIMLKYLMNDETEFNYSFDIFDPAEIANFGDPIIQVSIDGVPTNIYDSIFVGGYMIYLWNDAEYYRICMSEEDSQASSSNVVSHIEHGGKTVKKWNILDNIVIPLQKPARGLNKIAIIGHNDLLQLCDQLQDLWSAYGQTITDHMILRDATPPFIIAKCDNGEFLIQDEAQRKKYYDRLWKLAYKAEILEDETEVALDNLKVCINRKGLFRAGVVALTAGLGGKYATNWIEAKFAAIGGQLGKFLGNATAASTVDFAGEVATTIGISKVGEGVLDKKCGIACDVIRLLNEDKELQNQFLDLRQEIMLAYDHSVCEDKDEEPEPEDEPDEEGSEEDFPTESVGVGEDPAGFVYEGVEDNRIEGVQATVFYKDNHENIFGEMVEEEVMWDASEFDQENPIYTDENGFYQWFVPQGLWQVRFEKEGYEPTQSEWLPVPPPQLEVNIPIVQLRQPEVLNAIARNDAVDIVFDKYMLPELLNTDNILVIANGQKVEGSITLLDEQVSYSGESTTFASKARFVPASAFAASEITLTVSNRVRSYADVPMAQTFQQTFDIEGVGALEQTQAPEPSVPDGSLVTLGTELSLSCATEGAVIRYTLDGSTPDCLHGYVYNGVPLGLYGDQKAVISAIACADGFEPSELVQWTYTFGKDPTALEDAETKSLRIEKLLRNGQLLIRMPDGDIYTPIGQKVK